MGSMDERMQAELDRASILADKHRARVAFEADQAQRKWTRDSAERMQAGCLIQQLGPRGGFIDDYTAEVPLDIGFQYGPEGQELIFVAIGGHDVTMYLPPDVLAGIRSHIDQLGEA